METQNRFDLNQAIETWRQSLANRPGPAIGDIVEMETHLREEHAALRQTGLSEEEAFVIASKRLGPPVPLAEEFAKAVPGRIWRERLFWIAAVLLLLNLLEEVEMVLIEYLQWFVATDFFHAAVSSQWQEVIFGVTRQALNVGVMAAFIWYVSRHAGQASIRLDRWFPTRSRLVCAGLLAIFVVELPIWYWVHFDNAQFYSLMILADSEYLRLALNLGQFLFTPIFFLAMMAWALPSQSSARDWPNRFIPSHPQ